MKNNQCNEHYERKTAIPIWVRNEIQANNRGNQQNMRCITLHRTFCILYHHRIIRMYMRVQSIYIDYLNLYFGPYQCPNPLRLILSDTLESILLFLEILGKTQLQKTNPWVRLTMKNSCIWIATSTENRPPPLFPSDSNSLCIYVLVHMGTSTYIFIIPYHDAKTLDIQ